MSIETTTPWYWEPFDLFENCGAEARTAFFDLTAEQRYVKGDYILMANDPGRRIFFLESGIVKIFNLSSNGTQTIFWYCMKGDVFGAGAISGSPLQSVFAQAVEACRVHFIARNDFEAVMKRYPQIAINMVRLMSARLRLACDALVDFSHHTAESRLARVLLRLAHHYGTTVALNHLELGIRISNQELADMIGSTRQTVNTLLHDFSGHGWINLNGRNVVIVSQGDLQERADTERHS